MQAIELLIEKLAAQALQKQGKADASSAVQAIPTETADAADLTQSIPVPAESPNYNTDAGELDSQGILAELPPRKGLQPDEPSVALQSHECMQSVRPAAEGACVGKQRDASLALASSEGQHDAQHDSCIGSMAKGSLARNIDEKDCKQARPVQQEPKLIYKHERKPARNMPCPCGSGRRYKECCGPVQAAQQRKRSDGMQTSEPTADHRLCISGLYV